MKKIIILLNMTLFFLSTNVVADKAKVLDVAVTGSNGSYSFKVTVSHNDTGWKHYANKWDVLAEDGSILATRILYHPHVDEQPFTRSLGGIKIPENAKGVKVRAHDPVHGYGEEFEVLEFK